VTTVIETVDLISKKWHPAIIQTLLESGPLRFSELGTSLDGVSGKVLTESLSDLVDSGLVERTVVSESPKRVEYELTPHGRDLQEVIEALATWGDRHLGQDGLPKVLVVDDDPRLARMHADWLSEHYDVETVHSGADAIERLAEGDVDVLVLDRRMPGVSGEDVLDRLGRMDADPGVVLLTAVEPEFDVVDMPIDDYVVKHGLQSAVVDAVDRVLDRATLEDRVREYLALSAKRSVLRAETSRVEREHDEAYARLVERLERLDAELDEPVTDVDPETLREVLADAD
jgi:DNA-binding HxlR family transcriptional regulator